MISYTRELWQPRERTTSSLVVSLILIAAFACLTAVAARASILLPYTPVPITLQTLAVLLSGALLGSRAGASAQLAYVAAGAAGLPVGASGNFGMTWVMGPTFGYAIGFVAAAFVTGLMVERGWGKGIWRLAVAMVFGNLVIYVLGVARLGQFLDGGVQAAIVAGVLPFLIGDAIKIAVAAGVVPSARMLIAGVWDRTP
jgi:biotin transport system substrate-specific component